MIDTSIPWAEASENFTLHQKLESQGNFNFRYKSRRLCKPPFCDRDHSESIQDCKYKCANVVSGEAENVCRENIPVAKTIRFCNLAKLEKMTKEKDLDPRFIFLVRDPRGILNSRIKIYTSEVGLFTASTFEISLTVKMRRCDLNNPKLRHIRKLTEIEKLKV